MTDSQKVTLLEAAQIAMETNNRAAAKEIIYLLGIRLIPNVKNGTYAKWLAVNEEDFYASEGEAISNIITKLQVELSELLN